MCVHSQLTENKSVKRSNGYLEYRFSSAMAASSTYKCKRLKSFLLCATYRPLDCPTTCFTDDFMDKYSQALTHGKEIVVVGDLNCNMMNSSPESDALKGFVLIT